MEICYSQVQVTKELMYGMPSRVKDSGIFNKLEILHVRVQIED